jgi:hypothetical protein
VFMDHGNIVEQGPPARLFQDPQSERLQQFLQTWKERSQLFQETRPVPAEDGS